MYSTNGNDNMLGGNKFNQICGKGGNDNIDLRRNPDRDPFEIGVEETGDDHILGGFGDEIISGDQFSVGPGACYDDIRSRGADKLSGPDSPFYIRRFDCGPGNDRATINTSVDGDIVVHCETVIAG